MDSLEFIAPIFAGLLLAGSLGVLKGLGGAVVAVPLVAGSLLGAIFGEGRGAGIGSMIGAAVGLGTIAFHRHQQSHWAAVQEVLIRITGRLRF